MFSVVTPLTVDRLLKSGVCELEIREFYVNL